MNKDYANTQQIYDMGMGISNINISLEENLQCQPMSEEGVQVCLGLFSLSREELGQMMFPYFRYFSEEN